MKAIQLKQIQTNATDNNRLAGRKTKRLIPEITTVLLALFITSNSAWAKPDYMDNPVITQQFSQIDADGDGLISKAEVNAQPELTRYMDVSVQGSFEMGDINSDGMLNFAEFMANEEEISAE